MMESKETINMKELKFDDRQLMPVIVQDYRTMQVLMLAYANKEAVIKTLETGYAHFWSRTRRRLWLKGETSGNHLKVSKIYVDCDGDSLIYWSRPLGPTCHTGRRSCFFRELKK
ncbi:MAG: phosphoribosyl-AMP cyclohydrolase [Nitrososphaeria archaeon]